MKYLSYISLLISILSLWLPVKSKIKPWHLAFSIALVLAVVSHLASVLAVLVIGAFYLLLATYPKCSVYWKGIVWGLSLLLGLSLELHLIPGFHNLLVWDKVQLTNDALPFTLYLNLDKTAVGLCLLGLNLNLLSTVQEWKIVLKQLAYRLPLIILVILALSLVLGYVKFAPKLPQNLWLWVLSNLFFVCLAEEGLFRGFMQETLSRFHYKYSAVIAILISALLFGLIHYHGGINYIFLATIAGILYGWIYHVSKRIEASILAHFTLNLTHILLFTYPALLN